MVLWRNLYITKIDFYSYDCNNHDTFDSPIDLTDAFEKLFLKSD